MIFLSELIGIRSAPKTRLVKDHHKVLKTKQLSSLLWVPGNSGVKSIIIADDFARLGAETTPVGPEPMMGIYESPI